jgi:hypothetical protein
MLYVGHWVWFIVYHENDMYETQGDTHMACSHCPWYNKPPGTNQTRSLLQRATKDDCRAVSSVLALIQALRAAATAACTHAL